MISEVLLRKHHSRTRVHGQSQPVVQVHVLQPVVIDLKKTRRHFLRNISLLVF